MSKMVERVGEALRVKLIEWYAGGIGFEDGGLMLARAAIEEMREIPDEMARHIPYSPVISPWGAWENIINEALGEVKTVTGITDAALGDG